MKKHVILLTAALLTSTAFAENVSHEKFTYTDTVNLNGQILKIKEVNDSKVLFMGSAQQGELASDMPSFNYVFTLKDEQVALIGLATGGNACPVTYQMATMRGGKIKLSKEFGTCSDIPKIDATDTKITFKFPKMQGRGVETWIYTNGDVVKSK